MKKVLLALMVGMLACAACDNESEPGLFDDGKEVLAVLEPDTTFNAPNFTYDEELANDSTRKDTVTGAILVNSKEEYPIVCKTILNKLSTIDFSKYTLVEIYDYMQYYKSQTLVETPDSYILNIYIQPVHYTDERFFAIVYSRLWALYPKLKNKPLSVHYNYYKKISYDEYLKQR